LLKIENVNFGILMVFLLPT